MPQEKKLTNSFLLRYLLGVILSILAIGLAWLYSSHLQLLTETKTLKEQAVQRQMAQLKERVHQVRDMINHERQLLDEQMRTDIRLRTLEAYAVMESIYQQSKKDQGIKQIATMIRTSLRAIRYNDGRGYFFATGVDGIEQLFPPNSALEGTSFLNIRDMNGKPVVQDMIALVKEQGEGYYEYSWTKPGSPEGQHRKVAYIKYFEPLDWFVGTGEYIDDVVSDLQDELIRRIESTRFKDKGYIFVANYQGISLAYPAKGRNMYNVEDNNGLKIVQELIKRAKADGGYLRYVMPPLDGARPEEKISYVTGIPEWQWYLGSGDFVADLDQELAAMIAQQRASIRNKIGTIISVLALFLLLGLILSRQLGRQVHSSFQAFQNFFAQAATQAKPLDVAQQTFAEFKNLGQSANRMLEERHHFEMEAKEYRDQLSNVIDAMPSILTTVDCHGQVSQWNKFAVETTTISQAEASGKNLIELLPYLKESLAEILQKTCREQSIYQASIEIIEEEERRNKNISAYPLSSSLPQSVVIRIDDITERKLLEENLVQSEKMLSVGGLAAGMAHEVNNPLASIIQNIQLVQMRLSADNPKNRERAKSCQLDIDSLQSFLLASRVPEKLEQAMSSCTRAAKIVENMLNFSRSGQRDFKPASLGLIIDNTLELLANDYDLQQEYAFEQIKIQRNYAEGMPEVVCSASKIQQVIFNLLKNGVQAMIDGNIPVEERQFKIDIFAENRLATINISDSGPGIPETIRKRIFEPFFTTKGVGKGTGLGLFVAYFIVQENHGGSIKVDSAPGQGTSFTIKLPLNQVTS